jgi:hypothetical protein
MWSLWLRYLERTHFLAATLPYGYGFEGYLLQVEGGPAALATNAFAQVKHCTTACAADA